MDLFKLVARITLDTSEYKEQINNVLNDAESFSGNLKKVLASGSKLVIDTSGLKSAESETANKTKSLGDLIRSGLESAAGKASGTIKKAFDSLPSGVKKAATVSSNIVKTAKATVEEVAGHVKKAASVLGSGLKTVGKYASAVVGTVGTALVAVGKKSIEAYANYEQLVGGVETLFKDNAGLVQQYAANAYKTAGLSANQYMETVTGFSASLLQSVGGDTKKAAKLADMAITDMADNANKMGTSMESIQNAYQGFAKQNYSMLDNLKLGYGGTAKEMYRLMQHAAKTDEQFAKTAKFSIDTKGHLEASYSDIVKAINIVQKEMHISGLTAEEAAEAVRTGAMTEEEAFAAMGTTAKEANSTISGSLNATKAAWQNLLVGIADDNADIGKLVDEFVDSAVTAGSNLIPRIQKILDGAAKLVSVAAEKLLPVVVEAIMTNLPMLVNSAVSMVKTIVTTLTEPKTLSGLIDAAVEILLTLGEGIVEVLPKLVPAVLMIITSIVEKLTEPGTLHELVKASIDMIGEIATGLIDNLPTLLDAAYELAVALANELVHYDWWGLAKRIFASLKDAFKRLFTGDEEPETPQTPAPKPHGRHASGLKYVPFDEYHAVLHRGERVLTAKEAQEYEFKNASPVIAVGNNTESVKVMQQMLEELRATRQDMYTIILSALRTNSEGFSISDRDMARMVKKFAFT